MRKLLARLAIVAVLVAGAVAASASVAQGVPYSTLQGQGFAFTVNCNGESVFGTGPFWTVYTESKTSASVGLSLKGSGWGTDGNFYYFSVYGAQKFNYVSDQYDFVGKAMFFSATSPVNVQYDTNITAYVDNGQPDGFSGSFDNEACSWKV